MRQIAHGDKLPLFQMIAKNVGIRRARGRFVLVTNIDILFSDAVIQFMRDELRPGCLLPRRTATMCPDRGSRKRAVRAGAGILRRETVSGACDRLSR